MLPSEWLELAMGDPDQPRRPGSRHQSLAASAVQAHDFNGVLAARYLAMPLSDLNVEQAAADIGDAADAIGQAERFLESVPPRTLDQVATSDRWRALQEPARLRVDEWREAVWLTSRSVANLLDEGDLRVVMEAEPGDLSWLQSDDVHEARRGLLGQERSRQLRVCREVAQMLDADITSSDVALLLGSVRLPRYGSPANGIKSALNAVGTPSAVLGLYALTDGSPVALLLFGGTYAVVWAVAHYGRILVEVSGEALEARLRSFFHPDPEGGDENDQGD